MTSTRYALFLTLFGLRRATGYRPELHYMRGPGPKCRENRSFMSVVARS
jgi:hypothetical protein